MKRSEKFLSLEIKKKTSESIRMKRKLFTQKSLPRKENHKQYTVIQNIILENVSNATQFLQYFGKLIILEIVVYRKLQNLR